MSRSATRLPLLLIVALCCAAPARAFAQDDEDEPLLDLDALDGDIEARLSVLCHLVVELSARQQPFVLQIGGTVIGPDAGVDHRNRCLRELAVFALDRDGGR